MLAVNDAAALAPWLDSGMRRDRLLGEAEAAQEAEKQQRIAHLTMVTHRGRGLAPSLTQKSIHQAIDQAPWSS